MGTGEKGGPALYLWAKIKISSLAVKSPRDRRSERTLMHTAATTRAGVSIRAFALSAGLSAMVGGAAPGASAELKDPLSTLTSAGGSILCLGRDYSPDHLARHPKQMTKSVLLASSRDSSMSCSLRAGARRSGLARVAAGARERELTPPTAR
jgi:hypothetical protein